MKKQWKGRKFHCKNLFLLFMILVYVCITLQSSFCYAKKSDFLDYKTVKKNFKALETDAPEYDNGLQEFVVEQYNALTNWKDWSLPSAVSNFVTGSTTGTIADDKYKNTAPGKYYWRFVNCTGAYPGEYSRIEYLIYAIYVHYGNDEAGYKKVLNLIKSEGTIDSFKNDKGLYVATRDNLTKLAVYETYTKTVTKSSTNVDINSSESMATGDMYAKKTIDTTITKLDVPAGELEQKLSEFVCSGANRINSLLIDCDASLDNLVYGRLIHYDTNYYCFELVKANPYGIVGAKVYGLFRTIALPLILVIMLMQFAKASWRSGSGEARRTSIDAIGRCVLMVLFLFLMPTIIDALIALKDIMLNFILKNQNGSMSSLFGMDAGNNTTIIGYYKTNAESGFFLDALLYLGATFITFFYAITYISTAVAVMVNFMFFPLMTIFSFTDKKLVETWFKTMIGNIFTPLLDAVLLLMPLMLNTMLGSSNGVKAYIITFIATYAVIPSRAIIRNMLGVGGSVGSEMLGFGAMMASMRMMSGLKRRVGNGVRGLVESGKDIKHNNELANMYGDLARANGEGGQLTGRFGKLGKNSGKLSSVDDEKDKNKNGMGGIGSPDENKNDDKEQLNNGEGQGLQNPAGTPEENSLDSINDTDEDGAGLNNGSEQQPEELGSVTNDGGTNSGEDDVPIAASVANQGEDVVNAGIEGARSPAEQQAIDKNNILKSYANTGNFENKEFANAFNFAERAKLHKQKANRAMVHTAASAIGGIGGGVVGGTIGVGLASGATMFGGPQLNLTATVAGANYGSAIGSTVTSAANNAIAYAGMSDVAQSVIASTKTPVQSTKYAYNAARTAMAKGEKAVQYDNKKQIAHDKMNTYDGYYSKNPQYDASQTQANPSNLNNFGQYDPNREMEQRRRQQEFDAKMGYYQSRQQAYDEGYGGAVYGGYNENNISSYNEPYTNTAPIPEPEFENVQDVFSYMGHEPEIGTQAVNAFYDAFNNTSDSLHNEVMEQFNKMQANHIESKKAELERVPEDKRAEVIKKMKENVAKKHMATIATQMYMEGKKFNNEQQFQKAQELIYNFVKDNHR